MQRKKMRLMFVKNGISDSVACENGRNSYLNGTVNNRTWSE